MLQQSFQLAFDKSGPKPICIHREILPTRVLHFDPARFSDSKSSADGRLSPHRRLHWRINDVRTWWVGLWPRKMRPVWLRIRTWWLRFRVWHCDLRLICRRSNASLEVSFPTMYYSQPWPPDPELQSVDLAAGLLVLPDESPVRNRLVHATIPAKHA